MTFVIAFVIILAVGAAVAGFVAALLWIEDRFGEGWALFLALIGMATFVASCITLTASHELRRTQPKLTEGRSISQHGYVVTYCKDDIAIVAPKGVKVSCTRILEAD